MRPGKIYIIDQVHIVAPVVVVPGQIVDRELARYLAVQSMDDAGNIVADGTVEFEFAPIAPGVPTNQPVKVSAVYMPMGTNPGNDSEALLASDYPIFEFHIDRGDEDKPFQITPDGLEPAAFTVALVPWYQS